MVGCLAADDHVVLVPADLAPDGSRRATRLGQSAEVDQLSGRSDLGKCCTVFLGDHDEFSAICARPAPGRGTLPILAAEIGVADKVVEVDLFIVSVY